MEPDDRGRHRQDRSGPPVASGHRLDVRQGPGARRLAGAGDVTVPNSPSYLLKIRSRPAATPDVVRLRHVLKRLLRQYDFVCLSIEEVTPATVTTETTNPPEP